MRQILPTLVLLVSFTSYAATPALEFSPQRPEYQAAADEYAAIWAADGVRIMRLLEKSTRATLPDRHIDVVVFEGMSNSGSPGGPMFLRASYPYAVKQAAVVHELAHRFVDALDLRNACFTDVHQVLVLVLTDVWGQLWGDRFVEAQSAIEARRSQRYRGAWAGVLDKTPAAREKELDALLGPNCPTEN